MTTKQTTITVSDACTQLGLPEDQFRLLLKPLYPTKWETMKRISIRNYQAIAQALQEKALEMDETKEESDSEHYEVNSEHYEVNSEHYEVNSEHLETDSEQDKDALPKANDIINTVAEHPEIKQMTEKIETKETLAEHLASADQTEIDIPENQEPSDLATTDETTNLTTQQVEEKVRMQLELSLPDQMFNLNKISRALALVAADEAVVDFAEIYTHRLNSGINQIINCYASNTMEAAQRIRESDTSDFLNEVGKLQSVTTEEAMNQINSLLSC
ncbi:MAG: hypothetical protein KME30_30290 [Iphinoe sp. HA4291-MV1]|jgi:hypothetical protein|nr:hypothetical protein [Iphinoe sp. HA4291-MV1]